MSGQGCKKEIVSTLNPSSLVPVKINYWKIAVGQGVKVPSPDVAGPEGVNLGHLIGQFSRTRKAHGALPRFADAHHGSMSRVVVRVRSLLPLDLVRRFSTCFCCMATTPVCLLWPHVHIAIAPVAYQVFLEPGTYRSAS